MPRNPAPHIFARLIEIGLVESNGMDRQPISWREINEWRTASGVTIAPWEARLLHRLSCAYLAEARAAESDSRPAPWRAPLTDDDYDAEERALEALLG